MFRKTANTDQSGHFSLKAIAPGEYRLYAWETYVALQDLDSERLKPYDKNAGRVKLREGGHETVEITLNPLPVE